MDIVRVPNSSSTLDDDKCSDSSSIVAPESGEPTEETQFPAMDTEHREPTLHASDDGDDEANTALAAANSAPATEDTGLRLRRRAANSSDHSGDEQAVTTARADKGKGPASESNDNGTLPERPPEASDEFSCNICFDTASEPVLTICGHLFCWSCLVQWLERSATCPVCKAGCDKEKVIPVYGRGKEEKDPRSNPSIPNRPQGRRPPPPLPRQPNQFFGFDPFGVPGSFHGVGMGRGGGAVFVGGFGFLPALMGLSAFAGAQAGNAQPGGQPAGRQAFASRILMMLAAMILMSIVFY